MKKFMLIYAGLCCFGMSSATCFNDCSSSSIDSILFKYSSTKSSDNIFLVKVKDNSLRLIIQDLTNTIVHLMENEHSIFVYTLSGYDLYFDNNKTIYVSKGSSPGWILYTISSWLGDYNTPTYTYPGWILDTTSSRLGDYNNPTYTQTLICTSVKAFN
jgi:hypothetical protein